MIAAVLVGLLSVWIAAGSTGMLAHSLRRGLTLVALIGVVLLAWPMGRRRLSSLAWLAASIPLAAGLLAASLPPLNVLAVATVLLAVSRAHESRNRCVIQQIAQAAVLLAIYRIACTSIPWLWMIADGAGGILGSVAAVITRQPLRVGATFGGLDFLMVSFYLVIASLTRWKTATNYRWFCSLGLFLGAVLLGHLLYLAALSFSPAILQAACMKAADVTQSPEGSTLPPPGWVSQLRLMIPWNMPLLAALLQLGVTTALLLRIRRLPEPPLPGPRTRRTAIGFALAVTAMVMAAVAIMLVVLFPKASDLRGKKIVFYEKGFLNWLKPENGQYGRLMSGMYGLTPSFLESYGADALVSPDLSAKDLEGADAVVLLFPNEPWRDGQLERLWKFVADGGTLLVAGEHTVWEKEADGKLVDISTGKERNRFNEVLKPTTIHVNFDTAEFAIGGWLHSYEALAHPITTGIADQKNEFGVVIGASLNVRYPAQPVLIGRYGWASPGDPKNEDRALMGEENYVCGDKLGDIILVAERSVGKGKIVVFGDPSGFVNGILPGCHDFMARMYGYISQSGGIALPAWRLGLALFLLAALVLGLVIGGQPEAYAAAAVGLAISLLACTSATSRAWELLPDGRSMPNGSPRVPNNLAYIDMSHLGPYSSEGWRPEGLMGLTLQLMRNGYLALHLAEMTPQRLERARLLISVAPAKPFTQREIEMVEDFVRNGGVFISTVGYDGAGPSKQMLANLGFSIGQRPEDEQLGREPQPLGYFKAPFFNGGKYMAYVRFFAGWRVLCDDPDRLVISQYPTGEELIVMRRLGKGLIVVVGDSFFAMNKNLENEGGEPIDGMHENAVFWRWLLTLLQNGMGEGQTWIPAESDCTPIAPAAVPGGIPSQQLRSPDDPPDEDTPQNNSTPVGPPPDSPAVHVPSDKPKPLVEPRPVAEPKPAEKPEPSQPVP
jgi:hypothetical protein